MAYSLKYKDIEYTIFELLGKGKFGNVYRCNDNINDYAIKIIKEYKTTSEYRILKNLDHSNIIKLITGFANKGKLYIITEIFGKSLLSLNFLYIDYKTKYYILNQILNGLNYLHENSILHNDIKADNILIDSEYKIKICDFGNAEILDDNDRIIKISGTPIFLCPESLEHIITFKKDIWATGILFFELLEDIKLFVEFETKNDLYKAIKQFDIEIYRFETELDTKIMNLLLAKDRNIDITVKNILQLL